MAFVKKTWIDRVVQYANRRLLTKSGGEVEQVTVTRDEGTISEAGDQFNASNMNDLENRIKQSFDNIDSLIAEKLTDLNTPLTTGTATPKISYYASTASNKPSGNDGITITQGNGVYRQQLAIDLEGNIYARYYNNGTISNWKNEAGIKIDIKSLVTFSENITGTNTKFFVMGGVLYIYYQGESKAHANDDALFTLPAQYRPSGNYYFTAMVNQNTFGIVELANGVCKLWTLNASATGRVYFTAAIPLN